MQTLIFKKAMTLAIMPAVLIVTLICFSPDIFAQEDMPPHKAVERIIQLKKSKLLEVLDLKEEVADKFLVRYTAWDKKLMEQKKTVAESSADLEHSLRSGASKEEISKKSLRLVEAQIKLQDINTERIKAMKDVLGEVEYAKFLVFEERFPKELQRAIFNRQKDMKRPGDWRKK